MYGEIMRLSCVALIETVTFCAKVVESAIWHNNNKMLFLIGRLINTNDNLPFFRFSFGISKNLKFDKI
jgi:hypothetical protein